jgi:N,N'-diacetyllegionaminate synthase
MKIGNNEIGNGRTYVIADVGSNFNGSLNLAKEYIQAAKEIGVDAVKFQSYTAQSLLHQWKQNGERWQAYDVVKKYELPIDWHYELFEYAEKCGIEFLSTPFSLEIVDVLSEIGVRALKVASGDLTFIPLLKKVGTCGKPVILSTGMAYLGEITTAISRLQQSGAKDIVLLHCVSNYPPRYEIMNLRAIKTMNRVFDLPVGLSDHTPDDVTALGALALGSCMIEKHITMSKNLGTPDAPFAMTVEHFAEMIRRIRKLEPALGNGVKEPTSDEIEERLWARRGMYAREDIEEGEKLTLNNVIFLRPATSLTALDWPVYEGKTVRHRIERHKPIVSEDV